MALIFLVAGITLLGSFLCSLFEATLYAITPSQVEILKGSGRFGALRLVALKGKVEDPIAAILTINTLTHTVGSAWCGAMVGVEFGSAAVGVFAAVFTFAVLLLTEIIPKSLGVRHAQRLGPWVAWPIQGMIWLAWPLVKASGMLIRMLTGGMGDKPPSEDEVMALSRLAAEAGALRDQENLWVENALKLDRVCARDLMTPRTVVESFSQDLTLAQVESLATSWRHSRVPVTEGGNLDKVTGMVHRREVFDALVEGKTDATLGEMAQPLDFVPESLAGHRLMDKFIQEKRHMLAVVDEYGGFEGIVTLEDVLECLIGAEIVDEHDEVDDLQEHARREARQSDPGRSGDGDALS